MQLTMTEKIRPQAARWVVTDEMGQTAFTVREQGLSLQETFWIEPAGAGPTGLLQARWPRTGFELTEDGERVAVIVPGRRPRVELAQPEARWAVSGRLADRGCTLREGRRVVARIEGRALSLTHVYDLVIDRRAEALPVIATVLVLHRKPAGEKD